MKRFYSLLIASSLAIATGSLSVFAAEGGSQTGIGASEKSIGVNAKYVDSTTCGDVISVDLSWGAMEFTYTESGSKLWNPSTHEYVTSTLHEWVGKGNRITVTNNSNVQINAAFSYAKANGFNTVTGTFSKNLLSFSSAEGKSVGDPVLTDTVTFDLSGSLDKNVTDYTRVGTITVTLS